MGNLPKTKYFSIEDAAKFLQVSTKTLRRWEAAGVLSPVRTKGGHRRYTQTDLMQLKEKYSLIQEVRGIGLMMGVELKRPGVDIVTKARMKGLLINCTQDKVLRIMPAMTVTKRLIDRAVSILDQVLKAYVECQESAADLVKRGFDVNLIRELVRKIDYNEYKRRQAPPGLKVTSKAFGIGRRLPIAQRYRET